GLYRYVRNPMYLSVTMIILGEALVAHSVALAGYLAVWFVCANLFVIVYEESPCDSALESRTMSTLSGSDVGFRAFTSNRGKHVCPGSCSYLRCAFYWLRADLFTRSVLIVVGHCPAHHHRSAADRGYDHGNVRNGD